MGRNDTVPSTHLSLLHDLVDPDTQGEAWQRFQNLYGPLIRCWCRGSKLQDADAEDVSQQVLLKLSQSLSSYERSRGPFRKWLRTVVCNAVTDHFRRQQRHPGDQGSGDSNVLEILVQIEASGADDLASELDQRLQGDLQAALERARGRVDERTWQAFQRVVAEEQPAAEVAGQLGFTRAAVYQTVYRVKKMILDEYAKTHAGADAGEEDGP